MFRLLRRIAQEHLAIHLLIPTIVGISVEGAIAYWVSNARSWGALRQYLFSIERVGLLLGFLITYLVLMYYFIKRETDVGLKRLGVAELEETLRNANGYFAIATIKLKEWFDPAAQVYLATIINRKFADPEFKHERVLFLFTRTDVKNLSQPYLDGYYAKCLRDIHIQFRIPLDFIERRQIFEVLGKLSIQDRKALKLYLPPISWFPEPVLTRINLKWCRRRIRKLAFGLAEQRDGSSTVIRFSKKGQTLGLERVDDAEIVRVCHSIVESVKEIIYWPPGSSGFPNRRAKYDFNNYFF